MNKAKVEPKGRADQPASFTHSNDLDIYTLGDGDETRAAQGAFLKEMGMASEMILRIVG